MDKLHSDIRNKTNDNIRSIRQQQTINNNKTLNNRPMMVQKNNPTQKRYPNQNIKLVKQPVQNSNIKAIKTKNLSNQLHSHMFGETNLLNNSLTKKEKKILSIHKKRLYYTNYINKIYNTINFNTADKDNKVKFKKINKLIKKIEKINTYNNYFKLQNDVIIQLRNVTKFYTSKEITTRVLSNVSLQILKGDFVVILGPSGSGKTTLMNLISGIDKPTFGSVNVAGYLLENLNNRTLTSFRKDVIGYVFQRYGLLPNLTVYENVLMGRFLGKDTYSEKIFIKESNKNPAMKDFYSGTENEIILRVIEAVGLKDQINKYPYELSGGQKQRTSIARTLAKNPLIIFGDEPTAAVDEEMSKTIIDSFVKINTELKTTVVMITHDERIAFYANRVIYLKDGLIDRIVNKRKGTEVVWK